MSRLRIHQLSALIAALAKSGVKPSNSWLAALMQVSQAAVIHYSVHHMHVPQTNTLSLYWAYLGGCPASHMLWLHQQLHGLCTPMLYPPMLYEPLGISK